MCGGEGSRALRLAGMEADVVVEFVVPLDEGYGDVVAEYGMGVSEVIEMRVSAATMPPMEWPMRMTRTEGSMVGEGVPSLTSMSITKFWSLVSPQL